ncbi:hypothetical protein BH10CYA1_BH10CYA1_52940 [soil metagenome]
MTRGLEDQIPHWRKIFVFAAAMSLSLTMLGW